jgi:hypothetical protein
MKKSRREKLTMDIGVFWKIIDAARKENDGWEDMYEPLIDRLAKLAANEILSWKNIFDEYQSLSYKNKLWAAAYIINGGCGDDGFDYFRGWLTAQGKRVFMNALKDPDSLAEVEAAEGNVEFEDILGAAADAYFKKIGTEDKNYDLFYAELVKHPLPDELKKEIIAEIDYAKDIDIEWNDEKEDELKKILPKLCEAFDW